MLTGACVRVVRVCKHVCIVGINRDKELEERWALVLLQLMPDVMSWKRCSPSNKQPIRTQRRQRAVKTILAILRPLEVVFEAFFLCSNTAFKAPDRLHDSFREGEKKEGTSVGDLVDKTVGDNSAAIMWDCPDDFDVGLCDTTPTSLMYSRCFPELEKTKRSDGRLLKSPCLCYYVHLSMKSYWDSAG